jgi:hypothetical protein
MDIHWDPDFSSPLNKLGEYWHGWQINLYPERDDGPTIILEPFRQGQSTFYLFHNRALTLWSKVIDLVDATPLKKWLEERTGDLEEILEGFDTKWDGNNTIGTLTEDARETLGRLQMDMESAFEHTEELLQYWEVYDWFMNGNPEPDERDAEALVEEAKSAGAHLDLKEVQEYLEELAVEEELDGDEEDEDFGEAGEVYTPHQPTLH